MTLDEARELLAGPLWKSVRDHFLAGNPLTVYPAGDLRRLEYIDADLKQQASRWCDAMARLAEWRKVVSGKEVRDLKERFPGVYPEIFRYETYFSKCRNDEERLRMVLKVRFPDVYEMLER